MLQYTIRRIFMAIPVLFGIMLVTFSIARLIPGDPCTALLGEKATKKKCAIGLWKKMVITTQWPHNSSVI